VVVNYVSFDQPDEDPSRNTALLEAVIEKARIRKPESMALR
jgi:hypothetical protein